MICPPAYSYGYLQSMMRNDWTVSLYTPCRRSDSVWGVMVWRSWTFPGVVGRQSGNLPSPVLSVCSRATSGEWFSLLSLLNKNSWLKKKVHEKKLRISVSKSHLYRSRLQYTTKIEKSAGLMRRNRHESTQLILCYVGNFFRGFPKHFRIDRRCQIMIILLQNYVRNI